MTKYCLSLIFKEKKNKTQNHHNYGLRIYLMNVSNCNQQESVTKPQKRRRIK